ncbi:UPF0175 family protein [Oscillatoria sp. CS-180]|uniref:UPF0175 family protein n=1 Tax=Oscillatoria sp. CS-180 TaxID=3021720 RepID=UPI002330F1EC|nr:UPF0175 family protein [Oscillatoria sp. CS-180]MDB9524552.1 UPF0175 family protein [Oscillatoria sp. CS-180]
MASVQFDIPQKIFSELKTPPDQFAQQLRLAAAIYWYQKGQSNGCGPNAHVGRRGFLFGGAIAPSPNPKIGFWIARSRCGQWGLLR